MDVKWRSDIGHFSRQQLSDLMDTPERIQKNFLQVAVGSHYLPPNSRELVPGHRLSMSLRPSKLGGKHRVAGCEGQPDRYPS